MKVRFSCADPVPSFGVEFILATVAQSANKVGSLEKMCGDSL